MGALYDNAEAVVGSHFNLVVNLVPSEVIFTFFIEFFF